MVLVLLGEPGDDHVAVVDGLHLVHVEQVDPTVEPRVDRVQHFDDPEWRMRLQQCPVLLFLLNVQGKV